MLSLQSGGVALAQGEIQLDIRGSASSAPTCLRKESASSSTCVHGALRQLPGCARSRWRRCRRHVPLPTPRCPAPPPSLQPRIQPYLQSLAAVGATAAASALLCREEVGRTAALSESGSRAGELCRAGAEHAPSSRGTTKLCLHPADPGVPRSRPNLLAVGQIAASFRFPLWGGGSRHLGGLSCTASYQEPRKSSLCSSELSVA